MLPRAPGRTRLGYVNLVPPVLVRMRVLLALICFLPLGGCNREEADAGPLIQFIKIPQAEQGGRPMFETIEGSVTGARPGQRIVLYARSGAWYVQPFADQPFTDVQPDSKWRNSTHLGTEYAALLVEPEYQPPAVTDLLPVRGGAVAAVASTPGTPAFWQTWWFRSLVGLACLFALFAIYRYRLRLLTRQLNVRFEERLAERVRIAQELHDTLLQGVISASMQLHVVMENLAADSPARAPLSHIQQLIGQVIEEGRNAVQGLRSDGTHSLDLEQAFSRLRQDLRVEESSGFRVVVEGRPRPLHPVIRGEVYSIGREALVNAFRHSRAGSIEVEVEYAASHLRVLVSDDGCGIDSEVLRSGREGHWGLSGMRERAELIGARLKVRSRAAAGTEVELSVPGHIAYGTQSSGRKFRWFTRPHGEVEGEGDVRNPGSEAGK
ncbi:MAG: sensor histidine kinase [Rubrivivax sp.]|nr:sensor histidine kinase [Pyrinomonadaceae bacterium]